MLAALTTTCDNRQNDTTTEDKRRHLPTTNLTSNASTTSIKLVVKNPSKLFPTNDCDKVQSDTVDSPLRQVLTATAARTTTSVLTSTPLLAASLSTPPVTSRLLGGSSDATSSAAVDLSQRRSASPPEIPAAADHDDGSGLQTPHAYANLLLQLRDRVVVTTNNLVAKDINCNMTSAGNGKMTAAARKERLRLQPCFQCPVCKKRFQRHIAMNAHFQNEHIGSESGTGSGSKFCKLCPSYSSTDILSIRRHLLKVHRIDLENPVACLVDAEHHNQPPPPPPPTSILHPPNSPSSQTVFQVVHGVPDGASGRKRRSNCGGKGQQTKAKKVAPPSRSDDEDSSSSSLGSDIVPSSSVFSASSSSPEQRLSPTLIKQDPDENSATDLTLPKHLPLKRSTSPQPFKDASAASATAAIKLCKKRKYEKKVAVPKSDSSPPPMPTAAAASSESSSSSAASAAAASASTVFKYQCHHCLITFPNQTLYFLHRGFHSDVDPWKCNGCGQCCDNMYDFNTHLVSVAHN